MTPLFDHLSEDELLQQCRSGQQAAWSTLVKRFQRLIYSVPYRAGLGTETADDVFQNTLSRLQPGARLAAFA